MIHLLLKALAEGSTSDSPLILRVREGHMTYAGYHAILLNHGVRNPRHLSQVILSA